MIARSICMHTVTTYNVWCNVPQEKSIAETVLVHERSCLDFSSVRCAVQSIIDAAVVYCLFATSPKNSGRDLCLVRCAQKRNC